MDEAIQELPRKQYKVADGYAFNGPEGKRLSVGDVIELTELEAADFGPAVVPVEE